MSLAVIVGHQIQRKEHKVDDIYIFKFNAYDSNKFELHKKIPVKDIKEF